MKKQKSIPRIEGDTEGLNSARKCQSDCTCCAAQIGYTLVLNSLVLHVLLHSLAIHAALYVWLYMQHRIVCFHATVCTYVQPSQLTAHHLRPITHFSLVFSVGMYEAI